MTAYDVNFSATLASGAGNITAGLCVCPSLSGDTYVVANDTNFAAVGIMGGVAITVGAPPGSISVQYSGELAASITGLGPGAAAAVKRGSTGQLQRVVGTPLSTDYILGDCDTSGRMRLRDTSFINPAGGSSGVQATNKSDPITGGPFTTLNLATGLVGFDGGGGVLSIEATGETGVTGISSGPTDQLELDISTLCYINTGALTLTLVPGVDGIVPGFQLTLVLAAVPTGAGVRILYDSGTIDEKPIYYMTRQGQSVTLRFDGNVANASVVSTYREQVVFAAPALAPYQVLSDDQYVAIDGSNGPGPLLPLITGIYFPQVVTIYDAGNAGVNPFDINGNGKNINGSPTLTVNVQNRSTTLLFDAQADQWRVVGTNG